MTAQVTGKFLQLVPFAAHLDELAGEGDSPGGLTGDGSAAGAVQHQVGGARGAPRVNHEAIRMMIKPVQVTMVIIDKTLHAAHHPRCGSALSWHRGPRRQLHGDRVPWQAPSGCLGEPARPAVAPAGPVRAPRLCHDFLCDLFSQVIPQIISPSYITVILGFPSRLPTVTHMNLGTEKGSRPMADSPISNDGTRVS